MHIRLLLLHKTYWKNPVEKEPAVCFLRVRLYILIRLLLLHKTYWENLVRVFCYSYFNDADWLLLVFASPELDFSSLLNVI